MRYVNELMPTIDANPQRLRVNFPEINNEEFWKFYEQSARYSLLLVSGFYNLYQSICHIARNKLEGDFVECGCLFGGAAIFAHHVMRAKGIRRKIHLFDTFEGIPGEESDILSGGKSYGFAFQNYYEDVRQNINESGGDLDDFILMPGRVEETIPGNKIEKIAILRLDTDFYSSTLCELEYFYPKLVTGGPLIIDDYGVFRGSRDATDEYLEKLDNPPLLNRIDGAVWAGVKPHI